jgi:regulator of RNase E activity RraB
MPEYPDDAIGHALRDLAAEGNDMSAEMAIDFTVVVPLEKMAQKFARTAEAQGFRVGVWKRHGDDDWDVVCSKHVIATHENVLAAQRELAQLAMPFLGMYDGWATFGNTGKAAIERDG